MNLIFIITSICWLSSELFLNRLLHSKKTDRKDADKNSLTFIWIVIILSVITAIFISQFIYIEIFSLPEFQYIGIILIIIGLIIRFISIFTLGRLFTVDVTIRQDHFLKKNGIYKYLRHPSYFGSLISFIGFGISLNNWISVLEISTSIIAIFIMRIKIEEKVLTEQFGQEYIEYKKTTYGLIPFIY